MRVPVCALDYGACLAERVRHGDNGLLFSTGRQLAGCPFDLFETFCANRPRSIACAFGAPPLGASHRGSRLDERGEAGAVTVPLTAAVPASAGRQPSGWCRTPMTEASAYDPRMSERPSPEEIAKWQKWFAVVATARGHWSNSPPARPLNRTRCCTAHAAWHWTRVGTDPEARAQMLLYFAHAPRRRWSAGL